MPEKVATSQQGITRREFLYYAWLSSTVLFMAGTGGATLAYAFPRFKEGGLQDYYTPLYHDSYESTRVMS